MLGVSGVHPVWVRKGASAGSCDGSSPVGNNFGFSWLQASSNDESVAYTVDSGVTVNVFSVYASGQYFTTVHGCTGFWDSSNTLVAGVMNWRLMTPTGTQVAVDPCSG